MLSCVASSWASWYIVAHISVSSCLCDIFFAISSSSARSLSVSSWMMDPKWLISRDMCCVECLSIFVLLLCLNDIYGA